MISEQLSKHLNNQIQMEAQASMQYLAMASWAECNAFNGVSEFFYKHADEERMHMLKIMKFINERGGEAKVPAVDAPKSDFNDIYDLFEFFLGSEEKVTEHVNLVVFEALQAKNYTVHNFMQWFVTEQMEEEALARTILDKLSIIDKDKSGLYLFDQDINNIGVEA